jgi:transcription initiation factor TFIID subunit 12
MQCNSFEMLPKTKCAFADKKCVFSSVIKMYFGPQVEEILVQLADEFVENTVNAACLMAKHRKATTVEVKDVQLHLERNWNMWTPGFGTDELRPYKRAPVTEAHKQRLALIRKTLKKY